MPARADKNRPWWQHGPFTLERLTDDGEVKTNLKFSPDGSRIAYLRGRGDLWIADADGRNARKLIAVVERTGIRLVARRQMAGLRPERQRFQPRHLAPSRRRLAQAVQPVAPPLQRRQSRYGRRTAGSSPSPGGAVCPTWTFITSGSAPRTTRKAAANARWIKRWKRSTKCAISCAVRGEDKDDKPVAPGQVKAPDVAIDFDRIHERVRRIAIPDSTESGLFWSPDSKKLAFTATVEGQRGIYTVEVPDDLKPKLLTAQTGSRRAG